MSIDLTLTRIQRVFDLLPPYTRPTIHVAGTNGKGSVAAIISSILSASKLSVGRFNSPHLINIYDSIILNGRPVSPELYNSVRKEIETYTDISNFEILTLTALVIFERTQVDVVVMEAGMGGRLDATNVIPDSDILISVLTSVDLDHQAFLGNTVEAIAREKAAIARNGRAFVLAKQRYPEVVATVEEVVNAAGAHLIHASPVRSDGQTVIAQFKDNPLHLSFPLQGEHQLDNLAAALSVVSTIAVTADAVRTGVSTVEWPGRLSFHDINLTGERTLRVLADGAHNSASAVALSRYIASLKPSSVTYILALSNSPPKTPLQTLTPLLHPGCAVAALEFTPPEGMPWVKAVSRTEICKTAQSLVPGMETQECGDLRSALEWAAGRSGMVIVAGSLYLVSDLYRLLCIV